MEVGQLDPCCTIDDDRIDDHWCHNVFAYCPSCGNDAGFASFVYDPNEVFTCDQCDTAFSVSPPEKEPLGCRGRLSRSDWCGECLARWPLAA